MAKRPIIDSIQAVVAHDLCIACGACAAAAPPGAIEMRYDPSRGLPLPVIVDATRATGRGLEFTVCPGKGVPIEALARQRLIGGEAHHPELGYWNGIWAARSRDAAILQNASSGGVMTAIAAFLLESGRVRGAVATSMTYGAAGPRTRTDIVTTREALLAAQGSKYCPASAGLAFREARAFDGALAFVGTPCQTAALRLLQREVPEMRARFPFVIANFCGGCRDFRETDALLRRYGLEPARTVNFRYRGGGQPGSLRAVDDEGRVAERPYPDYVRDTGFGKERRCLLCIDATAELADFSCGDAWLPRFLQTGEPWSLLLTRTAAARETVEAMTARDLLTLENVTAEEVIAAQAINITAKKRRQDARRRFEEWRGRAVPEYDGAFPSTRGGLVFEAYVAVCRRVAEAAELGSPAGRILVALGRGLKRPARRARDFLRRARPK